MATACTPKAHDRHGTQRQPLPKLSRRKDLNAMMEWRPHIEKTEDDPFHPERQGDVYFSWLLPATTWSGYQYPEDYIKVYYSNYKQWYAWTEVNQNGCRDLTQEDILSIRNEFGLDRYIR
jgi:hypothetical protein